MQEEHMKDVVSGRFITKGKGENGPQGPSEFYSYDTPDFLAHSRFAQIEGSPMGHVNRTDLDRLLQTITHAAAGFDLNFGHVPFLAFGAKHGNPCGGAFDQNPSVALKKMLEGDLQAIFGGFVMTNFTIDGECAEILLHYKAEGGKARLLDGIVAPTFTVEAVNKLRSKSGRRRLIVNNALAQMNRWSLDASPLRVGVRGGYLKQGNYRYVPHLDSNNPDLKIYGRPVSEKALPNLILAWAICATSNSNTITLVKDGMLIGNGVGQQSRVRAARLAIFNAKDSGHITDDAVAWSDSFFPFPDGPLLLIQAGITTIFATSGSQNDHDTINICQNHSVRLLMLPDALARTFFGHGT